jgi:hypothetical protein
MAQFREILRQLFGQWRKMRDVPPHDSDGLSDDEEKKLTVLTYNKKLHSTGLQIVFGHSYGERKGIQRAPIPTIGKTRD